MNKAKIIKDFTSMFPVVSFIKCEGWQLVYCKTNSEFRTIFYFFNEDPPIGNTYIVHERKFNVTCRPETEERFRAVLWRVFQIQNHNEEELTTLLKLITGSRWSAVLEMINLAREAYLEEHNTIGILDDPILNGEE